MKAGHRGMPRVLASKLRLRRRVNWCRPSHHRCLVTPIHDGPRSNRDASSLAREYIAGARPSSSPILAYRSLSNQCAHAFTNDQHSATKSGESTAEKMSPSAREERAGSAFRIGTCTRFREPSVGRIVSARRTQSDGPESGHPTHRGKKYLTPFPFAETPRF